MALQCTAVTHSAVPLLTNLVGLSVQLPRLFLFAGTRLICCAVILEVAGLEMAEPANVSEFDVFDFSDK